eukprot:13038605-Alexandrium_andersonii.AAC.1
MRATPLFNLQLTTVPTSCSKACLMSLQLRSAGMFVTMICFEGKQEAEETEDVEQGNGGVDGPDAPPCLAMG